MNNINMFVDRPEICPSGSQWKSVENRDEESRLGVDGTRFAPNFCVCFQISMEKMGGKKLSGKKYCFHNQEKVIVVYY